MFDMLQIMGAAARRVSERGRPLCPSPGHGCAGAAPPIQKPLYRPGKPVAGAILAVAVSQEHTVSWGRL